MSEKGKAIINVLLCGLYMAVFRIPVVFLFAYLTCRSDTSVLLVLIMSGLVGLSILSGYALVSERSWQATVKWLVSLLLSFGLFPLLELAYGNFDYNGYHIGSVFLVMAMAMMVSDYCAGVLGSGPPPNSRR